VCSCVCREKGYIAIARRNPPTRSSTMTTAMANRIIRVADRPVLVTTPYVVRTVTASLTLADTTLEDAARTLGAGRWRVFRRITMPQIAPGLAAGALFAFMVSFDNFPISLWLADAQHNPIPLLVFQLIGNVFLAGDRGDVDPQQ
jgi:ABC-type spermidine/putrescine transport system permease subunit II